MHVRTRTMLMSAEIMSTMNWRISGRPRRRCRAFAPAFATLEERLAPATFVVTQFGDGVTRGTLRWAINQADQTRGPDTVLLKAGTYTLTRVGPEGNGGQTGALQVAGDVTIEGAGAARTKIVASGLSDRAFHVTGGNVTFSGLTISGGQAVQGGGILVDTGHVSLTHCVLSANVAQGVDGGAGQGGALYQTAGFLAVVDTQVTGNRAIGADAVTGSTSAGGSGEGGGFYLDSHVVATMSHVNFTDNTATGA